MGRARTRALAAASRCGANRVFLGPSWLAGWGAVTLPLNLRWVLIQSEGELPNEVDEPRFASRSLSASRRPAPGSCIWGSWEPHAEACLRVPGCVVCALFVAGRGSTWSGSASCAWRAASRAADDDSRGFGQTHGGRPPASVSLAPGGETLASPHLRGAPPFKPHAVEIDSRPLRAVLCLSDVAVPNFAARLQLPRLGPATGRTLNHRAGYG